MKLLWLIAAFAVGWFFWRALRRKLSDARGKRAARPAGTRLVACPRCGTYLPENEECDCGR